MTTALAGAVELLDRSLSYTRVALAEIESVPGSTPTPCHGWPLHRLLSHMDDALGAYTQAASGRLSPSPAARRSRPEQIRDHACALLGTWLEREPGPVAVGDRWLPAEVVVGAAALEIALHGWDLHETAGRPTPVPEALARPLLEVARTHDRHRLPCLTPPVTTVTAVTANGSERLLGFLGRT